MSSFDIVVPCYNYARYLPAAVESALSQRDVDVRVLIIDDKSSDETPEVCARLAADSRVTVRRHEVNAGLIGTANEGVIEWARGDYVVLLSADDSLTPGSLARAARVMDTHRDVHIVYGMARIFGDDDPVVTEDSGAGDYQIISSETFLEFNCRVGNPAGSPAVAVRASEQQRLGGYVRELPHTSDMEMWMRFAMNGPVGVIRDTQANYRWHGGNMTLAYVSGPIADFRERLQTCEYVYREHDDARIPALRGWIDKARVALAEQAIWLAGTAIEAGDMKSYDACITFMDEFAPELRQSKAWGRLQLKRAIGPAAAQGVRKVINRLRGESYAGVDADRRAFLERHKELGWWPDPIKS